MDFGTNNNNNRKKKKKKKKTNPRSVPCGKVREADNIDCEAVKQRNRHPKCLGGAASVNESEHTHTHKRDMGTILDPKSSRRNLLLSTAQQQLLLLLLFYFLIRGVITSFRKCAELRMKK